jgi:hypothetical protein
VPKATAKKNEAFDETIAATSKKPGIGANLVSAEKAYEELSDKVQSSRQQQRLVATDLYQERDVLHEYLKAKDKASLAQIESDVNNGRAIEAEAQTLNPITQVDFTEAPTGRFRLGENADKAKMEHQGEADLAWMREYRENLLFVAEQLRSWSVHACAAAGRELAELDAGLHHLKDLREKGERAMPRFLHQGGARGTKGGTSLPDSASVDPRPQLPKIEEREKSADVVEAKVIDSSTKGLVDTRIREAFAQLFSRDKLVFTPEYQRPIGSRTMNIFIESEDNPWPWNSEPAARDGLDKEASDQIKNEIGSVLKLALSTTTSHQKFINGSRGALKYLDATGLITIIAKVHYPGSLSRAIAPEVKPYPIEIKRASYAEQIEELKAEETRRAEVEAKAAEEKERLKKEGIQGGGDESDVRGIDGEPPLKKNRSKGRNKRKASE